jgi:septal ring factor EnvC (AmiA/AmiB activator)
MTIDRTAIEQSDGSMVITNDTVERLGELGVLTSGSYEVGSAEPSANRRGATDSKTEAKRRTRWRRKVDEQRAQIAKVETELARVDAKIDSLEDAAFAGGRGAARIWARVEEAKRIRTIVESQLERERAKLAAIVREARKNGAQPGWFR